MIAINPKAVKEVEIDGAKFKIGVVPFGKKVEIQASAHFNKDKKSVEEVSSLFFQNYEYVRWGVKGHSGLKFEDGSEVPFTSVKEKIGNVEHDVVSPETMEVYGANISMLSKICQEVTKLNYMQEQEAKN